MYVLVGSGERSLKAFIILVFFEGERKKERESNRPREETERISKKERDREREMVSERKWKTLLAWCENV